MPTEAMIQLLEPDGYYNFLGIEKGQASTDTAGTASLTNDTSIDEDAVKKAYRKLSLKHHPDKGGDVDTFRLLNRAQKVLTSPKLKQQYDILGIDLDDEDEDHKQDDTNPGEKAETTAVQGIVQELAEMAVKAVMNLLIRTAIMAAVSLLLVRYRWTLYPAILFLSYVALTVYRTPHGGLTGSLPPILMAGGLFLMHIGRPDASDDINWTWTFLLGESVVIAMFIHNSTAEIPKPPILLLVLAVFSFLASLFLRGMFWNYATVIGLELFIVAFVALAFPVMELILETVLNEKLKKVGDKVRAHHRHMERYYQSKIGTAHSID